MTFIISVQLEDGLIVASDNRIITINDCLDIIDYSDHIQKIQFWGNGLIVGTGEAMLLDRVIKKIKTTNDISNITHTIMREKEIRIAEIGSHPQIAKTQILYSRNDLASPTLFATDQIDRGITVVHPLESKSIRLFIYNTNIECILPYLISFQNTLKNYNEYQNFNASVEFNIESISDVFTIFSSQDKSISKSFHIFFKSKNKEAFYWVENPF